MVKVAVLGGAGGIGQPLSLLCKLNPQVDEVAVYDIAHAKGVAADLSHINTKAKVKGYVGADEIGEALANADIVVIPAGVPRKPGMTRDDLFGINAGIIRTLTTAIAEHAPKAFIAVITNPVDSIVPIVAETLKALGKYDPNRLFGVTNLDMVRARTFVAETKGLDVSTVTVPVIGGHAGTTILPLLSQATPKVEFTAEEQAALTDRIRTAGTEVVEAKAGAGSATLSMAAAGHEFVNQLIEAVSGEVVKTIAYVQSSVSETPFFSAPISVGRDGIIEHLGTGPLNEYEQAQLKEAVLPTLKASIDKGLAFVQEQGK